MPPSRLFRIRALDGSDPLPYDPHRLPSYGLSRRSPRGWGACPGGGGIDSIPRCLVRPHQQHGTRRVVDMKRVARAPRSRRPQATRATGAMRSCLGRDRCRPAALSSGPSPPGGATRRGRDPLRTPCRLLTAPGRSRDFPACSSRARRSDPRVSPRRRERCSSCGTGVGIRGTLSGGCMEPSIALGLSIAWSLSNLRGSPPGGERQCAQGCGHR